MNGLKSQHLDLTREVPRMQEWLDPGLGYNAKAMGHIKHVRGTRNCNLCDSHETELDRSVLNICAHVKHILHSRALHKRMDLPI